MNRLLLAAALAFAAHAASAQISLTAGQTNTQTFTGFTGAGFQAGPGLGQLSSEAFAVYGWSDGNVPFGGTGTTGDFARGISSGGETQGGIYSFTVVAALNTSSLGFQPGGSDFEPGTIYVKYRNDTGQAITSATVAYDVFVRNDQDRSSTVAFSYATGSCSVINPTTGLTFTALPDLTVTSAAAADATPSFVQNARSTMLTGLSVRGYTPVGNMNSECLYLAFTHAANGGANNRDEFALDNIAVTPATTAETRTVAFQSPASGTATEGGAAAAPVVVLTVANDGGTTVGSDAAVSGTFAVQSGSASSGDVSPATFTFASGSASGATVTGSVAAVDDALFEGTETATLGFSGLSGATAAPGTYALTVVDNDAEPVLVINEIDPDQGATDTAEFVELRGTPSQNLGAFVVVFADASGTTVAAADLDFTATGNTGYMVLCTATQTVSGACSTNSSQYTGIPDGTGIVALYVGAAASFPAGTPLTTANLRSAVVYGPVRSASLLAAVGETVQYVEGYAGTGAATPATVSLARTASGLYVSGTPSPGAANAETVTVDRTANVGGAGGYRLFSAPVVKAGGTERFNVHDLAQINLVQGVAAGSDAGGSYGPQYPAAPGPNLYLGYAGAGVYTPAATTADDLDPGKGFFWRLYDRDITPTSPEPYGAGTSRSYAFGNPAFQLALIGAPLGNTAGAPLAVTLTQHADGFYALGNPFLYPFYLGGVTAAGGTFQTTFQTYDGTSYQPREASFGTPSSGAVVAPWQGFFAESADLTGAGTPLTVRYDARHVAPTAAATDLVGRPTETALRLRLDGQTEAGALRDEAAVVRLDAGASDGWDRADASKLVPPTAAYALVAPVGERNGAPWRQALLAVPALRDVTLAFTTTHAGAFTITAEAVGLPAEATVRDLVTGETAPLGDGVTFASEPTGWTERFVVAFGRSTAGEPATAPGVTLSEPRPNPAAARATLTLRLGAPERVTATLVDALGRTVATLADGPLGGAHEIAVETAGLASGVYVVRVVGETFVQSRRLVVTR